MEVLPSIEPGQWGQALARCLEGLVRDGWVIIHQRVREPVAFETVQRTLARFPDLDPEILMLYAEMNGLEVAVGKPIMVREQYETVRLVREKAGQHYGRFSCLDEIYLPAEIGAALEAEFGAEGSGAVRTLEIRELADVFAPGEFFTYRDGRPVIYCPAIVGYGEWFGLTRADEIRLWRQPAREYGQSGADGRPGYHDQFAERAQALLREREREHPGNTWWVLRGEDHGSLAHPPVPLRWGEMLAVCLGILARGEERE